MSKHRNKIIVVDGVKFDSKKEAARWCECGYYGDATDVYMRLNTCGFADAMRALQ